MDLVFLLRSLFHVRLDPERDGDSVSTPLSHTDTC